MSSKSKTLVFFGSGPVAAQSLDFLVNQFKIEAVITKNIPPTPGATNLVLATASKHNLIVHLANNTAELNNIFNGWQPNSMAGLVIDYGVIISQSIISGFKYGIINSHFSLLPQWRGADPITYSILSGQSSTGVCLMKINNRLDEGDIIDSRNVDITSEDDNRSLTQKLIDISNKLLLDKLPSYLEGMISPYRQTASPLTYSRKIVKADGLIDWSKPATVIEREVRAYRTWPGSYSKLGNLELIIHQAEAITNKREVGELHISPEGDIVVGCRVGSIRLLKIKPRGKKIMSTKDLLNGYKSPTTPSYLIRVARRP